MEQLQVGLASWRLRFDAQSVTLLLLTHLDTLPSISVAMEALTRGTMTDRALSKHGTEGRVTPMPDFKTKLLTYLQDKMDEYTPTDIDINGRWIGGDEKLFYFIKALIHEVETWK